jgi:UrcA family protein
LAAFTTTSKVRAESPDSTSKAVRVSYADLNLQTAAGVEELYSRIDKAARRVCAQDGARLTAAAQQRFTKCVDASMSTAARSVNNASLTNLLASAAHGS